MSVVQQTIMDREKYKMWYEENYKEMRKIVLDFLEGSKVPLDESHIKRLKSIPDWVDREKIKKGQKLAQDYLFVISISELMSVYLLLLVENILRPLIYTNRSSTVKTAFKRYFATILRVLSWYETDILDEKSEARRNINCVNQMHCGVLAQMRTKTEEEIKIQSRLENRLKENMYAPGCPFIRKDLIEMRKRESMDFDDITAPNYLNQYTMALTQYAFMGLVVIYPEKQGIHESREKLEAFIHLWRYLGYLVGIEDKYNICAGSYDEVILKCQSVTELIFKPNLAKASPEWEHMSHAVCDGVDIVLDQLVFESTVVVLLDLFDLKSDAYWKKLSWKAKYKYYYYKLLTYFMPFKYVRDIFNKFVRSKLRIAQVKYPIKL